MCPPVCSRKLLLSCLLGLLLTTPLHGTAQQADPYRYLTRGLNSIGAEDYCIPGNDLDLSVQAITTVDFDVFPGMAVSYIEYSDYCVLQVSGSCTDYRDCSKLAALIRREIIEKGYSFQEVWNLEALLKSGGTAEELFLIGQQFIKSLGGDICNEAEYNGSVHFLAYLPWVTEAVVLAEGPVNLNLELVNNPDAGVVRIRAGVPVLLSNTFGFH